MIKNHYSADIQSFKNALNLQGTSQEMKGSFLILLIFVEDLPYL
jgi:hypothetical protein